jgi:hypothetical protein
LVDGLNLFGLRNHDFSDEIDELEKSSCNSDIILQVDLAGMNGIVADDANDIESLLHLPR